MPVAILLSEGGQHSPDVRVLGKLLAGHCEVKPAGGKYGLGTRIIARREAMRQDATFGILDGDFPDKWRKPENKPRQWKASDKTLLGWRWERKEIENYLIDPIVVQCSLKESAPDDAVYQHALRAARDSIFTYQAARVALSASRLRFRGLPSYFGKRRGKERHPFPDKLDEKACLAGIEAVVAKHRQTQIVSGDQVKIRFKQFLKKFQPGGENYEHFLTAFAGKDLLWAMNEAIRSLGFPGAWAFREKVLIGIAQSSDDIGEWLPEWRALQKIVKRT